MKNRTFVTVFIFFLCSYLLALAEDSYSRSDQERVEALKHLQDVVELYKEVKGYYPFSNGRRLDLQFINVHITDQTLEGDDLYIPSGITGPQLGLKILLEEMQRQGLDDRATFIYDERPVNPEDTCQKYFIYNWQGGAKQCYSISINLEEDLMNTEYSIGGSCYPYVLSNCADSNPPYWFIRNSE